MQVYQADLLKDLSEGKEIRSDYVEEVLCATDLALRATKEMIQAICHSVAAMATERHLCLILSVIKEKDKAFFLDAPLSPSDPFGDTVSLVVERFQEAKHQSAVFQMHLPIQVSWGCGLLLVYSLQFSRPSILHCKCLLTMRGHI